MAENRGYYEKFDVRRKDGRDQPGGDREGAQYFTLDLTYDRECSLPALKAYAEAAREHAPDLYDDLKARGWL